MTRSLTPGDSWLASHLGTTIKKEIETICIEGATSGHIKKSLSVTLLRKSVKEKKSIKNPSTLILSCVLTTRGCHTGMRDKINDMLSMISLTCSSGWGHLRDVNKRFMSQSLEKNFFHAFWKKISRKNGARGKNKKDEWFYAATNHHYCRLFNNNSPPAVVKNWPCRIVHYENLAMSQHHVTATNQIFPWT